MNTKQTGLFISKKRKEKKMTQSELAEILQVTDKAISRWETGEGYPEVTILPKLAYTLGVSVDELLNGESPESTETTSVKVVSLFEMLSRSSIAITLFGLLIGIGLIYLKDDKFTSIIPTAIGWFIGFLLYQYAKYQFIKEAIYNDMDKFIIYRQSKLQIIALLSVVAILLPQFILKFIIDSMGYGLSYVTGENYLDFLTFLWSSILFLIVSIPINMLVIRIYKSVTYKHERITHNSMVYRTLMVSLFLYVMVFFGLMGYEFVWGTMDQLIFFIPIVVIFPNVYLAILDKKGGINLILAIILSVGLIITANRHDSFMRDLRLVMPLGYFEYSFWFYMIAFVGSITMMVLEVHSEKAFNERFFSYLRNIIITIAFLTIFLTYSSRALHAYVGFITIPMILIGFGFELLLRYPKYLKPVLNGSIYAMIIPLLLSLVLPIMYVRFRDFDLTLFNLLEGVILPINQTSNFEFEPFTLLLIPLLGMTILILLFGLKHLIIKNAKVHFTLNMVFSVLAIGLSIVTIMLSYYFSFRLLDDFDLSGLSSGGFMWVMSAISFSVLVIIDGFVRLKE